MNLRNLLIPIPAVVVAAIAASVLTGPPSSAHADTTAPLRVAVAGDSLTAFPDSWWHQLHDPSITDGGGLAVAGATSNYIANTITRSDPDVLVIELGTNDVRHGVPLATTRANIEKIVAITHPLHVLIVNLPPSNQTESPWGYNAQTGNLVESRSLVSLALAHGWLIADPFAPWRSYLGRYAGGATDDGVHPTAAVFAQIAPRMAAYIRQADLAATGAAQ